MGERHVQRMAHQQPGLLGPPRAERIRPFVLSPCESTSGSCNYSAMSRRELVPLHRIVVAAAEEQRPGERDRQLGEIGIALVGSKHVEGGLHVAIAFAISSSCCQVSDAQLATEREQPGA